MNSHFRGVVWPKQGTLDKQPIAGPSGRKLYRYVVVGMVVSDEPLENVEGKSEILLDGHAAGMAEAISTIRQTKPSFLLGDAEQVLLVLENIVKEDDLG